MSCQPDPGYNYKKREKSHLVHKSTLISGILLIYLGKLSNYRLVYLTLRTSMGATERKMESWKFNVFSNRFYYF